MSSNIEAKIFKPVKSATQYRLDGTQKWKLEFEPCNTKYIEPLMNWVGSKDPLQQLNLYFSNLEDAILYAEKNGIKYYIFKENSGKKKVKSYASNFL